MGIRCKYDLIRVKQRPHIVTPHTLELFRFIAMLDNFFKQVLSSFCYRIISTQNVDSSSIIIYIFHLQLESNELTKLCSLNACQESVILCRFFDVLYLTREVYETN